MSIRAVELVSSGRAHGATATADTLFQDGAQTVQFVTNQIDFPHQHIIENDGGNSGGQTGDGRHQGFSNARSLNA